MERKERISPFSVILIFAAISVVGILCAHNLNISYTPKEKSDSIEVSFSYPEASARIVEEQVTSKIEASLYGLRNCISISSVSSRGKGNVSVKFRKGTDMQSARLELATQLRIIYPSFPQGVTYPDISIGTLGVGNTEVLGFQIKGDFSSKDLYEYASENIVKPLSDIAGVDKIEIHGYTPFRWEIMFEAEKVAAYQIDPDEILNSIGDYFRTDELGYVKSANDAQTVVYLQVGHTGGFEDIRLIPVKRVHNKIIYLSDIATFKYVESEPTSYYRVNGLNTISLGVYTSSNSNNIRVSENVKDAMNDLAAGFPPSVSYSVEYDSSDYIKIELRKIWKRTILSLVILLLFVLAVYRSFKYTMAVALSIAVNIMVAIVFYYLFGLQINIYSLAGITVSLGIIIDSSIVMSDHYSYYKNRVAFVAIFAAVATTIASLISVFLIPYNERFNLTDFIAAVSINLFISLLVAYFFVPALLSYIPSVQKITAANKRHKRNAKWNVIYAKYIDKALRFKWLYILLLIMGFGIPICLIPTKTEISLSKDVHYGKVVRKIAEWEPYSKNKEWIDRIASSSFGSFYRSLSRIDFKRATERQYLSIRAGLSEGHTVAQLNKLVEEMERYISQFEEIEYFKTSVTSYNDALIEVYFKKQYEGGFVPKAIKSEVIKGAVNFGGANWIISGIDDNYFNNFVGGSGYTNFIEMYGYDYDELTKYAELLISYLNKSPRVKLPQIRSNWFTAPRSEYNLSYNRDSYMAAGGINPYSYYRGLKNKLYKKEASILTNTGWESIVLKSSNTNSYDLWNVLNSPIDVDSSAVTLSQIGQIVKKKTDLNIIRENQSYKILVSYNFVGDNELNKKLTGRILAYMNGTVLPPGYKATTASFAFMNGNKNSKYLWLILVIIAIIYVTLSILLESFRLPLAIMMLIPLSFIGFFLTFGFSSLIFDQGGLAALIMLCGLVVNAGIYLIWDYKANDKKMQIRRYIKSYNHKIRPIFLTILSTILGLVPFVIDGSQEAFWFDFAIGTISGLVCSIIALIFFLPVFVIKRNKHS